MLDFDTNHCHKNENIKVDVHSVLTVVSSTPVKPGQVHKFSPLDHSMQPHSLHLVYYFRNNSSGPFELDGLRMALSKVLSMYPPVTGRLRRDENGSWEVSCNDTGVRVLKANVNVTVDEWMKSANGCQERDLTAWENMPQDPTMWSPFRIQVNEFVGGGLAVGLSCSHMHADLTLIATFFKAWTTTHRGQPIPHPPSFKALHSHSKSSDVPRQPKLSQLKMSTVTFNFSNSAIKQCLEEIHSHYAKATATPFDLLAAVFWKCVDDANKSDVKDANKSDVKDKHSLSVCVDFRKVLSEPLPLGYFGNALHFSNLSATDKEMNDTNWLPNLAGLINLHTSSINDEKIQSAMERSNSPTYGPELTCICMEHLIETHTGKSIFYETMFEKGEKPVHVSCHIGNAQGKGMVIVMPSPDGGLSRNVMVTLPADQLEKLYADENIVSLRPNLILR